jgi:hypothetical protein
MNNHIIGAQNPANKFNYDRNRQQQYRDNKDDGDSKSRQYVPRNFQQKVSDDRVSNKNDYQQSAKNKDTKAPSMYGPGDALGRNTGREIERAKSNYVNNRTRDVEYNSFNNNHFSGRGNQNKRPLPPDASGSHYGPLSGQAVQNQRAAEAFVTSFDSFQQGNAQKKTRFS